jgi:hypothetical protein
MLASGGSPRARALLLDHAHAWSDDLDPPIAQG